MEPNETPTQPQEPTQPNSKIHTSMEQVTLPGEELLYVLRRHPFGIIVMYIQALVAFGVISALALILLPDIIDSSNIEGAKTAVSFGLVGFGVVLALIMLIITYIYRQNKLILTTRNVTQIAQFSLFAHQIAELDLNDIEDVTADKTGIWSVLFNFGMLRIETAGEKNYFHFQYCPNPDHYGQILLNARDECKRRPRP